MRNPIAKAACANRLRRRTGSERGQNVPKVTAVLGKARVGRATSQSQGLRVACSKWKCIGVPARRIAREFQTFDGGERVGAGDRVCRGRGAPPLDLCEARVIG
jgi:hypothetical protein